MLRKPDVTIRFFLLEKKSSTIHFLDSAKVGILKKWPFKSWKMVAQGIYLHYKNDKLGTGD